MPEKTLSNICVDCKDAEGSHTIRRRSLCTLVTRATPPFAIVDDDVLI